MSAAPPFYLIACGGTGGHLFPGIAVGEQLAARGARVALVVSSKQVDQDAVRTVRDMEVWTLHGAQGTHGSLGRLLAGVRGWMQSMTELRSHLKADRPLAVLAMGGFTSAAPVVVGRLRGARVVLHEANAIPGRATRWLSRMAHEALVFFPAAAERLSGVPTRVVGMPVRSQFEPGDAGSCRVLFGLDPVRPTVLIMGGSQGARAINELFIQSLPFVAKRLPLLQFIHLAGPADASKSAEACKAAGVKAVVKPFLTEMEWALGAADLVVSRSGASSLAEFAAMQLPAVLIPLPNSADDHQRANAEAFRSTGAAVVLEQASATPEVLVDRLATLLDSPASRQRMRSALAGWHQESATQRVCDALLKLADPEWLKQTELGGLGAIGAGLESNVFATEPAGRGGLGGFRKR